MKVGDKISVNIGPHEVGQAEVVEINNNEAVLIVPARRVVMGIRTELTDLPGTTPSSETVILGTDGEASAVVGDTPSVDNNVSTPPAPVEGVADAVTPATPPAAVEAPSVEAPAPVAPVEPVEVPSDGQNQPVEPVENNGGG